MVTKRLLKNFNKRSQSGNEESHFEYTKEDWNQYKDMIDFLTDATHRYRGTAEKEKIANEISDTMNFFW